MLEKAATRSYQELLRDHLAEYRGWFRRVSLALGGTAPEVRELPTDQRVKRIAAAPDPDLAALYYQFGRYLLIASSRPGTEPANLQGIWNDMSNPWWDSKYTININLPMNYWPAESGNLAELEGPLGVRRRGGHRRRRNRPRALGRPRLGAAPEHRPLAPDRDGRGLRQRRSGLGDVGRCRVRGSHNTCTSTTCSAGIATTCAPRPTRR